MSKNDGLTLGDIMDEFYANPVVNESIKKGGNDFNDKNPLPVEKDKSAKGGYKKTLNDLSDSVIDNEEDEEEDCDECDDEKDEEEEKDENGKKKWTPPWEKEEDEETIQESTKNIKKTLNKGMAKKSIFDTLYSRVLKENFGQEDSFGGQEDDLGALGLDDASTDDEMGDDFGSEEDDSVTFTLDRATAQTLIDVLQGALGSEEEGDDDFGGEDEGADDFGGEDDGMDFEEDEEVQGTKPAPDKKGAFQGKSNKVGGKVNPKGGKASTDVTDEVGTKDGAPPITALQGKGNQVPGSSLKPKADYFK